MALYKLAYIIIIIMTGVRIALKTVLKTVDGGANVICRLEDYSSIKYDCETSKESLVSFQHFQRLSGLKLLVFFSRLSKNIFRTGYLAYSE